MLSKLVLVFCQLILTISCTLISTPNGDILGYSSNKTDIYLGIRYGQIPARWTAAQLTQPWNGTYNATGLGAICHQYGPFQLPGPSNENEDCLFLNIWVPKPTTTTANVLLPVRVWLHGGGYTAGRSDDYDSENLAYLSQSIIVTLNYRLGIFGFFPLPTVVDRNLGWLDQQLALKWIQANIESFGGDKTNVLLFGESAGGGSSIAHLIIESSRPLYSSIILESAGPYRLPICVEKEKVNWQFLQQSFPECQSNLTCYQNLDASVFYPKFSMHWISLWPCVGEQSQLLEQPLTLLRKGQFNRQANILAGFNANEGQSPTFIFNGNNMTITSDRYFDLAEQYEVPSELTHRYDPTTTDKNYFNAVSWLLGDYYLNCPIIYVLNHTAAYSSASIYAYRFLHPTINWAFTPLNFNATHLSEIPFVFQNQFALTQLTPEEIKLSSTMIELFTQFHKSKQPWSTFQPNQTMILFDLEKISFQNGFDETLIERCSHVLKYIDPTDCHGFSTQTECLSIANCQWINEHCEPSSSFSFLSK